MDHNNNNEGSIFQMDRKEYRLTTPVCLITPFFKLQLWHGKKTHFGANPYTCSHCTKAFTQKSNFMTHQGTQTGEKPYPCNHCSYSYAETENLVKHQRAHTG